MFYRMDGSDKQKQNCLLRFGFSMTMKIFEFSFKLVNANKSSLFQLIIASTNIDPQT